VIDMNEEKRIFKFTGERILLTLTQLQGLLPGTPTKHVLASWELGKRPWWPMAVTIPEKFVGCGMKDCEEFAVDLLETAFIGRSDIVFPACKKHGLMEKIRIMFWDYNISISDSDLEDFISRMMAKSGEKDGKEDERSAKS